MGTAQAQANYMASIGTWSDYGPGGSTLGERLLAAGYPLAGDLSSGGIASQNVIQGTSSMTAQAAIMPGMEMTQSIKLRCFLRVDRYWRRRDLFRRRRLLCDCLCPTYRQWTTTSLYAFNGANGRYTRFTKPIDCFGNCQHT